MVLGGVSYKRVSNRRKVSGGVTVRRETKHKEGDYGFSDKNSEIEMEQLRVKEIGEKEIT